MSSASFLIPLLLIGIPVSGLLLGAVLPPFYYARRRRLAIILNLIGFFIYAVPTWCLSVLASCGVKGPITATDLLIGTAITLSHFVIIEGFVFLLRWLYRRFITRS